MSVDGKVYTMERGWPGHFCCADRCLYRRNTLVFYKGVNVVVSSVGNLIMDNHIEEIGADRYYETMAFMGIRNGAYVDADTTRQLFFPFESQLTSRDLEKSQENLDLLMDIKHNAVVSYFKKEIRNIYKERIQE